MRFFAAAIALLLLGGCSDAATMVITKSVQDARQLNDDEARLIKAATCIVRLGAFLRIYNKAEQDAMEILCRGETRDDLGEFRQ